jgi:6-phosphogluconolactonase
MESSSRPDGSDAPQQHHEEEEEEEGPGAMVAGSAAPQAAATKGAPLPNSYLAASKEGLASHLAAAILRCAAAAVRDRGAFSVALSGGSLPGLLASLATTTDLDRHDPPSFDKWHVILADERMVPIDHPDSNLGELNRVALSQLPIPPSHIYGPRLPGSKDSGDAPEDEDDQAIASEYDATIRRGALVHTAGALDLAVLGFGPDGHTCSLFPHHPLLTLCDDSVWVASISDSPKPPPRRITLTLSMLNRSTRSVIFCGAGSSKSPILQQVFRSVHPVAASEEEPTTLSTTSHLYRGFLSDPPPYPCAMVRPALQPAASHSDSDSTAASVTWIVDADAVQGVVPSAAL